MSAQEQSVQQKMLINATHPEELRVALVQNGKLYDLDIERPSHQPHKKGDIFLGVITRIEPSLEAAFVDYGAERQGFLPLKEVSPEYFQAVRNKPQSEEDGGEKRQSIKDLLSEGQELLIQIEKEERGSKGAALTTFISLAGRYLVIMPNNPRGGISRQIQSEEERERVREIVKALPISDGMGLIVRTAGLGKSMEDLQWDLHILTTQWNAIRQACQSLNAPILIHQEGDVVTRAIRDNLRKEVTEIIVDDQQTFVKIKNYLNHVDPNLVKILKLYQDAISLFNRFEIEKQIETAHQRKVVLPSGGSLVIDRTEALVAIDINSSRATGAKTIEDTAFQTNLEAAEAIARQLRIRDLGGLIVIDFIDMSNTKHQREVENCLRDALSADRARIQVGRISRFGLLEMSRQRLRPALSDVSQLACPHCQGRGVIRTVESLTLSILRVIEEEAYKPNVSHVHAQLPVNIATYLMNEKRLMLLEIERRHQVHIVVVPNPYFESPNYEVRGIKQAGDKAKNSPAGMPSYAIPQAPELEAHVSKEVQSRQPAVDDLMQHALKHPKAEQIGVFKRVWSALFGDGEASAPATKKPVRKHTRGGGKSQRGGRGRGRQQRDGGQRGGRQGGGRGRRRPQQRRGGQQNRGQQGGGNSGGQRRRRPPTKQAQNSE